MEKELLDFIDAVKNSFLKVKEDIISLQNELNENKGLILNLKQEITELKENKNKMEVKSDLKQENQVLEKSSNGNEGVYSFIHSLSKHSFTHIKDIDSTFLRLRKQEFLIFLTIYQLEDDIGYVTYNELSKKVKLSDGCVRMYVSNILKKGLPIVKKKLNNRITILSLSKEFRELNMKSRLIDLYHKADPNQMRLSDI